MTARLHTPTRRHWIGQTLPLLALASLPGLLRAAPPASPAATAVAVSMSVAF